MGSEKDWVDLLAALLTPTVAVIATGIGLLQLKINRARLKHELFDRRYSQFCAVRDFLGSIMRNGKATSEEQQKYLIGVTGLSFLFSSELQEYLHENVWCPAIDLETAQAEFKHLPVSEERTRLVHKAADLKKQIPVTLSEVESRFKPYLQLNH